MSHTNYEILEIAAVPWENTWVVNDQQYEVADESVPDTSFFVHEGEEIHTIRWDVYTKTIVIELGYHEDRSVTSRGMTTIENVDDPRQHHLLSKCIYYFEMGYIDSIYGMAQGCIEDCREAAEDDIKNGFNFRAMKTQFLTDSDWMMLPDSGASDEQREEWRQWRQRIRDWQDLGSPEANVRGLTVPTPPSTTDFLGKSLWEVFDNFEEYQRQLRRLNSVDTLNFTRNDITKEEYLENGPIPGDKLWEDLFSENQFLRKYGLQS